MPANLTDFQEELARLTVPRLLANRAEEIGERRALVDGHAGDSYTFRKVHRQTNAIANSLIERGLDEGAHVAVMAQNPVIAVLSMVGINKAGGVYAPINVELTGDPLVYQIDDSTPNVLIVEDRFFDRFDAIADTLDHRPHVVRVATDGATRQLDDRFETSAFEMYLGGSTEEPPVDVAWHDPASIIYTSGTTGLPKGVVLPQRWIFGNYVRVRHHLLDRTDVFHSSLPMNHVGGIYWDLCTAWVSGATAVLWERFSPNEFWNRIDAYDATCASLVSVMSTWLTKQEGEHRASSLTKVHMQPLPENYDEMADRFGFEYVTVGFGQTETGMPLFGSIRPGEAPADTPGKPADQVATHLRDADVPIVDAAPDDRYMGRPVSNMVTTTVLDEHDEVAPTGMPGELAVRPHGAGLILDRYLDKPDKTAEALRNVWFHTGDAVYRDEAGNYFYVDREGDVIRRRGENISSHQVQEIVNTHDRVAKAAAYPVPAREGGEDEVAVTVEPVEGTSLKEADLREFFDERMPAFMHPKYVEFVDVIPTTASNKIEKYKLRTQLVEREGL